MQRSPEPRPRTARHWVGLVALALLASPLGGIPPAPRSAGPNIILILADDLGYGDLGCYGSQAIATPHLDELARRGTRYTHAYAGSPVCAPSRCVLMTGLNTGRAFIRDNNPTVGGTREQFADGREGGVRLSLRAEDHTVADVLSASGYATGIAGKWGLAEPGTPGTPNRKGFDEWLGYLNQNHAAYYFTDYLDENEGIRRIPENADGRRNVYSNDLMADFAVDFVQRHRERPFFLYLPFTIPHNRMEVPDLGDYAARDWPEDAKIYAAMVSRLDEYVGRLVSELDRLDLAGDTLILFTSDNGPIDQPRSALLHSTGGLRGRKSTLYEGGLRVPTIACWPGRVPAGRVSDTPWMFADILPTCAELAGATLPTDLDGRSIAAVLTGEDRVTDERAFYWEFPRDRLHQAARLGRWKAVRFGTDQPIELYDLATDPNETTDVSARHPDEVARLRAVLDASHHPSPHWPVH